MIENNLKQENKQIENQNQYEKKANFQEQNQNEKQQIKDIWQQKINLNISNNNNKDCSNSNGSINFLSNNFSIDNTSNQQKESQQLSQNIDFQINNNREFNIQLTKSENRVKSVSIQLPDQQYDNEIQKQNQKQFSMCQINRQLGQSVQNPREKLNSRQEQNSLFGLGNKERNNCFINSIGNKNNKQQQQVQSSGNLVAQKNKKQLFTNFIDEIEQVDVVNFQKITSQFDNISDEDSQKNNLENNSINNNIQNQQTVNTNTMQFSNQQQNINSDQQNVKKNKKLLTLETNINKKKIQIQQKKIQLSLSQSLKKQEQDNSSSNNCNNIQTKQIINLENQEKNKIEDMVKSNINNNPINNGESDKIENLITNEKKLKQNIKYTQNLQMHPDQTNQQQNTQDSELDNNRKQDQQQENHQNLEKKLNLDQQKQELDTSIKICLTSEKQKTSKIDQQANYSYSETPKEVRDQKRNQLRNRVKLSLFGKTDSININNDNQQNKADNEHNKIEKVSNLPSCKTQQSNSSIFVRFSSQKSQADISKEEIENQNGIFRIQGNFEDYYQEYEILGEGCVGLVKKARNLKTNKFYASKMVSTRDDETIENILSEFQHLKKLQHPNIVQVFEVYIDQVKGKVYTIMELINGKEMFDVIQSLGHYTEETARIIFLQILQAIDYMHDQFVCHRDLKPNNILCDENGNEVKITDFNVSKFSDAYKDYSSLKQEHKIEMWTYTGTIAFSAPEIFADGCYDEAIDIWSAGCILYTMLSGHEPFQAEYVDDLIKLIKSGKFDFDEQIWKNFSSDVKDLIRKCLTLDPVQRIQPKQALEHPWILKQDQLVSPSKNFIQRSHLKQNLGRLTKKRQFLEDTSPKSKNILMEKQQQMQNILFKNCNFFGNKYEELPFQKYDEQLEYDQSSEPKTNDFFHGQNSFRNEFQIRSKQNSSGLIFFNKDTDEQNMDEIEGDLDDGFNYNLFKYESSSSNNNTPKNKNLISEFENVCEQKNNKQNQNQNDQNQFKIIENRMQKVNSEQLQVFKNLDEKITNLNNEKQQQQEKQSDIKNTQDNINNNNNLNQNECNKLQQNQNNSDQKCQKQYYCIDNIQTIQEQVIECEKHQDSSQYESQNQYSQNQDESNSPHNNNNNNLQNNLEQIQKNIENIKFKNKYVDVKNQFSKKRNSVNLQHNQIKLFQIKRDADSDTDQKNQYNYTSNSNIDKDNQNNHQVKLPKNKLKRTKSQILRQINQNSKIKQINKQNYEEGDNINTVDKNSEDLIQIIQNKDKRKKENSNVKIQKSIKNIKYYNKEEEEDSGYQSENSSD